MSKAAIVFVLLLLLAAAAFAAYYFGFLDSLLGLGDVKPTKFSFKQNLKDQLTTAGGTVTFSVTLSNSTDVMYLWQQTTTPIDLIPSSSTPPSTGTGGIHIDWKQITSCTTNTCQIPITTSNQNNVFRVMVIGPNDTLISSLATVTVGSTPVITKHPQNQTATGCGVIGTPSCKVTFTVEATATPMSSLKYQWQGSNKNTPTTWFNYSLATSPTYSFVPVITQNGQMVRCLVSSGSEVTSNTATLTVLA